MSDNMEKIERYVQQLTDCQTRLYAYILMLLPNHDAAADVLQETNLVLWRKAGEFAEGTDFGAWACKIAYYQVLTHRKRKGRERLRFSEKFAIAVADEIAAITAESGDDQERLRQCLEKLGAAERELLRDYYSGVTVIELAQKFGRSAASLYKNLAILRRALRACIERAAQRGEFDEGERGGTP